MLPNGRLIMDNTLKVLPEMACDGCNKKGCMGTISSYYLCKDCYEHIKAKLGKNVEEIGNKVWMKNPMFQGGSSDTVGC